MSKGLRRWYGSVLAIHGRFYIQVRDTEGRWRQRATGLVAAKENWAKAEALLADVRARLLAGAPDESMTATRRRVLRSFHGSPAIRLTLKRRLAAAGHTKCEACGWIPPPPATWRCLNVHHVKPRAKGGTDDATNLVVLCPNCHAVAHALTQKGCTHSREGLLGALASQHDVLTDTDVERTSTDIATG